MEVMAMMLGAQMLVFKLVSLPKKRALPFLLAWPGMDPKPWEVEARPSPGFALIGQGALLMLLGAAIAALIPTVPLHVRPWLAIAALLCLGHMGAFDIAAGAWRLMGRPVERIC